MHGKLKLDPSQLECEWDGKQLPDKLTTTEFLIVKELAKRPGIIKERSQLMDIAYREDTEIEDRTIDSHVKRIRKKFKKIDNNFSAIETRYPKDSRKEKFLNYSSNWFWQNRVLRHSYLLANQEIKISREDQSIIHYTITCIKSRCL